MPSHNAQRLGSVYVITLVTVAAIVSMVLLGVSLRRAGSDGSALVEMGSENNTGVADAAELAIGTILNDLMWDTTAQSGAVFPNMVVGGRTFAAAVADAATQSTPTYDTDTYRITVASELGAARSMARFDLRHERVDYHEFLKRFDLQHYWPLNEIGSPTRAADRNAAYHGDWLDPSVAGASTNDQGGFVPVFDDTANLDHVRIPWDSDFEQDEAAMSMWVKWTGDQALQFYGILGMLWDNELNDAPTLSLGVFNNSLIAYISDDGSFSFSNYAMASGYQLTAGAWHHVAISWGGAGFKIYLDGTRIAHNAGLTEGTGTQEAEYGGELPLLIGTGFLVSGSSYSAEDFAGSIAHVAMFNDDLSTSEAAELASFIPDEFESELIAGSWVRVFD